MTHDRTRHTALGSRPKPTVQDVEATLRDHLVRARSPQHVYQELRARVVGPLATIVRQHEVTPEGTCRACSADAAGGTTPDRAVPCAAVAPIAADLGLHLQWLNPVTS